MQGISESGLTIYCGYTDLTDETLQGLQGLSRFNVVYVDVSGDDEAYWNMLSGAWLKGETFANIEHDVVLPEGHMEEMFECPSLWCSSAYPYFDDNVYHGLGCVKFHADLLAQLPTLMYQVGELEISMEHPFRHWCALDTCLTSLLERNGIGLCEHPNVGHVDRRDHLAHGCWMVEPKNGRARKWSQEISCGTCAADRKNRPAESFGNARIVLPNRGDI